VAITPKEQFDGPLFPDDPQANARPLEQSGEGATAAEEGGSPARWPLENGDVTDAQQGATPPAPGSTPPNGGAAVVPPVPAEPQFTEYVVVKGDMPETIARKTLQSPQAWPKIAAANPGVDPRKLKPGQKLKIPAKTAAPATDGLAGTAPGTQQPGLAPAPTPEPAPVAAAERTYVVQPGDTLSDISRRELGSASKWRQLLEANSDVLHGSEAVRAGMKLKIPGGAVARSSGSTPTPTPVAATPVPKPSGGGKTYTVASGDTLSSIASRLLGSSGRWRELLAANESVLHGSDKLRAGMVLTIPEGVSAR
jgi:nucleoid-associated protein YgaU